MSPLTPDQLRIKTAVLKEVKQWLQQKETINLHLLKSRHVRSLLDVSRTTLSNLRKTGALPATKVGGNYRYEYNDILKYLEEKNHNQFLK